jgi:hypothetical protein
MDRPVYVFLDPDGTAGPVAPWMYVVVEKQTGVVYQQQFGGNVTRFGQVEGYLVPVHAPEALEELRDLFERTFRGAGTWDYDWSGSATEPGHRGAPLPSDPLRRLRDAVRRIPFWTTNCDGDAEQRDLLKVDEDRLAEVDEAWVPVLTPAGPGVLLWPNSD